MNAYDLTGLRPTPPQPPAVNIHKLSCAHGWYFYSDADGLFEVRWTCWANDVNWFYHISAGVRAIIDGDVWEGGLEFWINFSYAGKNAPHPAEDPWYWFHGTIPRVSNYDWVQYSDVIDFLVNVKGDEGWANLDFFGTLFLTP